MRSVLLVDDDESVTAGLSNALRRREFDVTLASTFANAEQLLVSNEYGVVVIDPRLTGVTLPDGLARLARLITRAPATRFVVLSAYVTEAAVISCCRPIAALLHKPQPFAPVAEMIDSLYTAPVSRAV